MNKADSLLESGAWTLQWLFLKSPLGAKRTLNSSHFAATFWKIDYSLRGRLVKYFLATPGRCWWVIYPITYAGIIAHMESLLCPILTCWSLCLWHPGGHAHLRILLTSCQDCLLPVKPIYTVAELCSCLTTACQPLSSPFILFHPVMALLSTDTTLCPHPQSLSLFTLFQSDPSPVFAQAAASLTLFSHFLPGISNLSRCPYSHSPCITLFLLSDYKPFCYHAYKNL